MKIFSILTIIGCLFLFSCKKDEKAPPVNITSDIKSAVIINLSDFLRKVEDYPSGRKANAKTGSIEGVVGHIYYMIYNNSTQGLVRYKHQSYSSDSSQFGLFADSLANGSYTMIVAASTDTLRLNANTLSTARIVRNLTSEAQLPYLGDVFSKKITFDVGPGGYISDVELDRIVSKLEVRLKDATYPLYETTIAAYPEANEYNLNTGLPLVDGATSPNITLQQANDTTFSSFVLNTAAEFSVKVMVRNTLTNITVEKVIENVRCYSNRKTIITGNISSFDPNLPFGLTDFGIHVNDTWDNDGPTIPY